MACFKNIIGTHLIKEYQLFDTMKSINAGYDVSSKGTINVL